MSLSTARPTQRRRLGVLLLSACLLSAPACRAERPTPEQTVEQFLQNLSMGRGKQAWKTLSPATRTEIERRAAALAAVTGEPPPKDPSRLLFQEAGLVALRKPESVAVVGRQTETEATVRVSLKTGDTANVKMVREGRLWTIDLFASLEGFPIATTTTATTGVSPRSGP